MRYRTQAGNLSAKEMTDAHLENRVKFEIDKLQVAKIVLNGTTDELTPFQAILHAQNNNMTLDKAKTIVKEIETQVAPLILELILRKRPIDIYIKVLTNLLERGTLISISPASLFTLSEG